MLVSAPGYRRQRALLFVGRQIEVVMYQWTGRCRYGMADNSLFLSVALYPLRTTGSCHSPDEHRHACLVRVQSSSCISYTLYHHVVSSLTHA